MFAVLTLLLVKSFCEAVEKSTSKEAAKDCDDDGVGFGFAVLRVIEPRAAVG